MFNADMFGEGFQGAPELSPVAVAELLHLAEKLGDMPVSAVAAWLRAVLAELPRSR